MLHRIPPKKRSRPACWWSIHYWRRVTYRAKVRSVTSRGEGLPQNSQDKPSGRESGGGLPGRHPDRGCSGTDPPGVVYCYTPGRGGRNDERIALLIQTSKMNGIDPHAYLKVGYARGHRLADIPPRTHQPAAALGLYPSLTLKPRWVGNNAYNPTGRDCDLPGA